MEEARRFMRRAQSLDSPAAGVAAALERHGSLQIDGLPALHCLAEDVPLFDAPPPAKAPLLLAPLDPLIYDRRLTRLLWGFDYTWEAYVPPAKRKRGHYSLPVLAGTEIVGHVDPRADRAAGRLRIAARCVRRGHATGPAVRALADFLGLRR